jgi:hypothetical protein
MKTEFMDQKSIIDLLKSQGLEPIAKKDTARLIISEKVIRCEAGDTLIAGMGSDMKDKDDQIHLVVDAVHLCCQNKKNSLKLIFGKREKADEQAEVENAVALMTGSIKIPLIVETQLDLELCLFKSVPFGEDRKWMKDLLEEDRNIPDLAKDLERAVNDALFKWYRPVTGRYWSGRAGGLEVCKIDPTGQKLILKVGSPGKDKDGPARQEFHKILARDNLKEGSVSHLEIEKAASAIRATAESRKNGVLKKFQREHLLESQVLSGIVEVVSKDGILKPVCVDYPFQFPTLWAPKAKPRFVDALMRLGDIPYVVELKEPSGYSRGQGYRHAITQAVLYREYVCKDEKVHPWFKKRGLDPEKCRAVVAFPELPKADKKKQEILRQHKRVGDAFGVEIVDIKGFE